MKRFVLAFAALCALTLSGCGNLSPQLNPKLDQKLDNQNGKIGAIDSMQNSMKAEIGKLQSQAEITNSKLEKIQQGLINLQQNNDNHGVQIFSGPGGIVLGAILVICLSLVLLHYRSKAQIHEKTASILAEKVVRHNNLQLENEVFEAVLHTNVAKNMLDLIKKQKSLIQPLESLQK
jgi:predicted PurR-regulated permease PerM